MKNLFSFRLSSVFMLLLFAFSVNASTVSGEIPGPILGNWFNPMDGSLGHAGTYIYLDKNDQLHVQISVFTTDHNTDLYDNLHISYQFGEISDVFPDPVTKDDFVQIDTCVYQATYNLHLDFSSYCANDTDGMIPIVIMMGLTTKVNGIYKDYPLENNLGFFNPPQYEQLSPVLAIFDKALLCWGSNPPYNMVSNSNGEFDDASPKGNELSDYSSLDQNIMKKEVLAMASISPNPFTNKIQVEYSLEVASDIQIRIMDVSGKQIINRNLPAQSKGYHRLSFDLDDGLSSGIYTLQLYYADKAKVFKLVKLKTSS